MCEKTISSLFVVRALAVFMLLFSLLFDCDAFAYSQSDDHYKASCFITDNDGNILLIRDLKTKRYRLPGGEVKASDEENSALWHLRFLTGFNATLGNKLAQIDNHSIYSCQLLSQRSYFNNVNGTRTVIAWITLLSSKQVSLPLLVPQNHNIIKREYTKPTEVDYFSQWYTKTQASNFNQITNGVEILPAIYRVQHKWAVSLREKMLNYQAIANLAKIFPAGGAVLFPLLFTVSLPFFRAYYGFRPFLIYSAGLVYLGLFSILLNQYFPVPPPHFADPSFIPVGMNLYGFPTNEVLFFSFVFSWLIIRWPSQKYKLRKISIALIGLLLIGISSQKAIIFGESYPSSILLSLVFGIASSYALKNARNIRLKNRKKVLVSTRFWVFTSILVIFISSITHIERMYYIEAFCIGACSCLVMLKFIPNYSASIRSDARLRFFLLGTFGVSVLIISAVSFVSIANEHRTIFYLRSFVMWFIPLWLLLFMPKIFQHYLIKRQVKSKIKDNVSSMGS